MFEISVFDYTDYRKYLAEYYRIQKKKNKAFSYRYFAQKANLASPGLYKELVDGKRNLNRVLIQKFADAMKLRKREAEYFENMVYFNEAKKIDERKIYFERMMSAYHSKAYKLHKKQYTYFSEWYYIAIREILSYIRFKDNYKELANTLNPSIRVDQAKKAIQVLKDLNLIEQDQEGYYKQKSQVLTTGPQPQEKQLELLNIINFQKRMTEMGLESYDRFPLEQLDMSTLTLSISSETFHAIKVELSDFRKKILGMAEKDSNPNKIYQINYQLFPLSKN